MATYEELRQRHVADAAGLLPGLIERLDWSAERLAAHRQAELRRLVRVAKDLSPWHRKRLSDVNPDEVDESMLAELPVMTKDDLMANFDEIVTDDRLHLDVVEDHLDSLTGDAYLFDRYHAVASGGSTGRRGVFVYDWDSWAIFYWSALRYEIRALRQDAPGRHARSRSPWCTPITPPMSRAPWARPSRPARSSCIAFRSHCRSTRSSRGSTPVSRPCSRVPVRPVRPRQGGPPRTAADRAGPSQLRRRTSAARDPGRPRRSVERAGHQPLWGLGVRRPCVLRPRSRAASQ